MSKKLLFAALFALCLSITGIAVAEEAAETPQAPDCSRTVVLDADSEEGTVVRTEDGETTTLEEILADNPQDARATYIDSGICCSGSGDCPTISGYSKYCVSFGSCWPNKKTCIYR